MADISNLAVGDVAAMGKSGYGATDDGNVAGASSSSQLSPPSWRASSRANGKDRSLSKLRALSLTHHASGGASSRIVHSEAHVGYSDAKLLSSPAPLSRSQRKPKKEKWKEYTDRATGRKYYSNGVITTWEMPACLDSSNIETDRNDGDAVVSRPSEEKAERTTTITVQDKSVKRSSKRCTRSRRDATLPPGWKSFKDKSIGRNYYHHRPSGRTTWERPTVVAGVTKSPSEQQSTASSQVATEDGKSKKPIVSSLEDQNSKKSKQGDLPPGWKVARDRTNGRAYYYNRSSGKVCWDKPSSPPPDATEEFEISIGQIELLKPDGESPPVKNRIARMFGIRKCSSDITDSVKTNATVMSSTVGSKVKRQVGRLTSPLPTRTSFSDVDRNAEGGEKQKPPEKPVSCLRVSPYFAISSNTNNESLMEPYSIEHNCAKERTAQQQSERRVTFKDDLHLVKEDLRRGRSINSGRPDGRRKARSASPFSNRIFTDSDRSAQQSTPILRAAKPTAVTNRISKASRPTLRTGAATSIGSDTLSRLNSRFTSQMKLAKTAMSCTPTMLAGATIDHGNGFVDSRAASDPVVQSDCDVIERASVVSCSPNEEEGIEMGYEPTLVGIGNELAKVPHIDDDTNSGHEKNEISAPSSSGIGALNKFATHAKQRSSRLMLHQKSLQKSLSSRLDSLAAKKLHVPGKEIDAKESSIPASSCDTPDDDVVLNGEYVDDATVTEAVTPTLAKEQSMPEQRMEVKESSLPTSSSDAGVELTFEDHFVLNDQHAVDATATRATIPATLDYTPSPLNVELPRINSEFSSESPTGVDEFSKTDSFFKGDSQRENEITTKREESLVMTAEDTEIIDQEQECVHDSKACEGAIGADEKDSESIVEPMELPSNGLEEIVSYCPVSSELVTGKSGMLYPRDQSTPLTSPKDLMKSNLLLRHPPASNSRSSGEGKSSALEAMNQASHEDSAKSEDHRSFTSCDDTRRLERVIISDENQDFASCDGRMNDAASTNIVEQEEAHSESALYSQDEEKALLTKNILREGNPIVDDDFDHQDSACSILSQETQCTGTVQSELDSLTYKTKVTNEKGFLDLNKKLFGVPPLQAKKSIPPDLTKHEQLEHSDNSQKPSWGVGEMRRSNYGISNNVYEEIGIERKIANEHGQQFAAKLPQMRPVVPKLYNHESFPQNNPVDVDELSVSAASFTTAGTIDDASSLIDDSRGLGRMKCLVKCCTGTAEEDASNVLKKDSAGVVLDAGEALIFPGSTDRASDRFNILDKAADYFDGKLCDMILGEKYDCHEFDMDCKTEYDGKTYDGKTRDGKTHYDATTAYGDEGDKDEQNMKEARADTDAVRMHNVVFVSQDTDANDPAVKFLS